MFVIAISREGYTRFRPTWKASVSMHPKNKAHTSWIACADPCTYLSSVDMDVTQVMTRMTTAPCSHVTINWKGYMYVYSIITVLHSRQNWWKLGVIYMDITKWKLGGMVHVHISTSCMWWLIKISQFFLFMTYIELFPFSTIYL